ncbi:MAG: hypothetical protein HON90_03845 [Halobacteriovoraceae bacterium]|jgi:hypothetical protein|nr:hypothetical protein [Halobacteriovoraceae bacterium]
MFKSLFFLITISVFSMNSFATSYEASVTAYSCDEVSVNEYDYICVVQFKNLESTGPKFMAIIVSEDFDYTNGDFVNKDARYIVDLSYVEKISASLEQNLKQSYGAKYEYFYHSTASFGGFDDVMQLLQR